MKLSTRSRYGLQAMATLAAHEAAGGGSCVTLKVIAKNHGMSEYYLEQLFAPLKKAGLVKSLRGAHGGYKLARPAAEVTPGDVLRALEGSLSPVECLNDETTVCAAKCESCTTKPVWEKLYAGVNEALDNINLADLI